MSDLNLNLVPVTASSQTDAPTEPSAPVPPPSPALAAAPEPAAAPSDASTAAGRSRPRRRQPAEPTRTAAAPAASVGEGMWRTWEQPQQTFSYRLPPELVDELTERMYQLRIREVGVTVAAAITQLLDLDDDDLLELVNRADAAKPRRRAAGRPRV